MSAKNIQSPENTTFFIEKLSGLVWRFIFLFIAMSDNVISYPNSGLYFKEKKLIPIPMLDNWGPIPFLEACLISVCVPVIMLDAGLA